jgi:predicted 3-demethylubiquinone-9 3-methyltransferase (glyoxalase superfamily)
VIAMEDNSDHRFTFTFGVSLIVQCDDQAEADRYWDALIADGGEPSMCGWLQDPYGLSWQIWPDHLTELFTSPDADAVARARQAMYQMQKLDIATLRRAFEGT